MLNKKVTNYQNILTFSPYAENVWHKLHGIFAIYKPPGEHILQAMQTLKVHLCRDLNNLKVRPPSQHVWIEGETNKQMTVAVGPSYADHPLLVGPRYQLDDVKLAWSNNLSSDTSGIVVFGIRNGTRMSSMINVTKPTKFYRVKGILGRATDNFFVTGKVVEKSRFEHVRREHIDKICAAMQSSHQKTMFELCGVHIQSQAAYELAVQGPIRPANEKIPMLYSIKCIDYKSPEFTLEIVCTNEYEMYLKGIIHELGMQVRSNAACSQIQCVRYGVFTLEHALLKKHWNLDCIVRNMIECRKLLAENKFMTKQRDPILKEYSSQRRIQATSKPQIKSSPQSLIESTIKPEIKSTIESQIESTIKPQLESTIETKIESTTKLLTA